MTGINGPYIAGTVADPTQVNARFADIEGEITDSASRSGKGGFSAPVRTADGTVAAPAHAFTSEPASGLYKAAAGDVRISLSGVDGLQITSAGLTLAQGALVKATGTNTAVQIRGNLNAADVGGEFLFQSTATRTAGLMVAVQNPAGNNLLLIDYQGLVRLANTAAIQPASVWTAATLNSGWTGGVSYFKDACGCVHVKGSAQFATGGAAAAFNFPAGFRATRIVPIVDWGAQSAVVATVDQTTGAVGTLAAPVNAHLYYFDAISFVADA